MICVTGKLLFIRAWNDCDPIRTERTRQQFKVETSESSGRGRRFQPRRVYTSESTHHATEEL